MSIDLLLRDNLHIMPQSTAYREALVRSVSSNFKYQNYYALPFDEKQLMLHQKYSTNWNALYSEPFASLVARRRLAIDELKPLSKHMFTSAPSRYRIDLAPKMERAQLKNQYRTDCDPFSIEGISTESKQALFSLRLLSARKSLMPSRIAPRDARNARDSQSVKKEDSEHDRDRWTDRSDPASAHRKTLPKEKESRVRRWVFAGEW